MGADSMSSEEMTQLLSAIDNGSTDAADALLPLVYDELRALAGALFRQQHVSHTLQPTALVHEAYLKLIGRDGDDPAWNGRDHFFCIAARAMRQVLLNHARDHSRQKRGGGWKRITLSGQAVDRPVIDFLALEEAIVELERRDARQARIVELKFYGEASTERIARILDLSPRSVQLEWKMASSWLQIRLEGETRQ